MRFLIFISLVLGFILACASEGGSGPKKKIQPRKIMNQIQGQVLRMTPVVPIERVQAGEVVERLSKMRNWFLQNLKASGEMTYQYRVGENKRSQADNNMIRQFMATLALFRLADDLNDGALRAEAEKNLDFNLKHYMKLDEEKKIAYIYSGGKVKLGAAAFALMALLESKQQPERDKLIGYFKNFILSMQEETGAFRTFYIPHGRNDNQNFYPGEALLALMTLYQSDPVQYRDLLNPVRMAFLYYRNFFRKEPNPAFVPWHTMAWYRYYQARPSPEIAQFIFEINDFLIGIQNTPDSVKTPWPDAMGRFYDPTRKQYGPPHASSTAVYVEGLVDALRLAEQLGDKTHQEKYSYAIRWGLRSLFQLQYGEETLVWIADKTAASGGIRTTETNADIRVDNTQHAAMAFLNVLSLPNQGEAVLVQPKE